MSSRSARSPSGRLNRTSVGLKQKGFQEQGEGSGPGLNRTSVGLKQSFRPSGADLSPGLNRTSVGLKPRIPSTVTRRRSTPQSNQRGIETGNPRGRSLRRHGPPQSNQRGIETVIAHPGRQGFGARLNRTSVGLKRFSEIAVVPARLGASIEPAWD